MTVVEYDGRIVVVDVGLRFPTPEMVGIDLVLPDFSYLRERAEDIEAIVITHGHEDHLGALPWVLRELGERRPAARLRRRADDRDGALEARRAQAARRRAQRGRRPARALELGPFSLELVHMTHSIPDSSAVALGTDLGTVLITGDYKFDQTPVDGAAGGRLAPGRARARGRAAAVRRLDERRPRGLLAVGVGRRPAPGGGVRALRGADRGDELRLEHPPRAAGRRRRRRARPQGRAGRALDAQERRHRAHARPHRDPRRACSSGRARSTTSPTSAS